MILHDQTGPDRLRPGDWPVPQPGPGEVRVALKAAAVNRRDLGLATARQAASLPCVLGSDGAGVIDALGPGVDPAMSGLEVVIYPAREWGPSQASYGRGLRVLGMPDQGTFAEFICVPAEEVVARPAHLSWHQAAAIPLAGLTAWRAAVTHGEVGPGMKVLVTGAGSGVSTFAVQWCLRHGAEVWVTSGSTDKIDRAVELGASGGCDYRDPDWAKTLRKRAGGMDLVIDSAGGDGLHDCLDMLRAAGRYVFFGATLGNPARPLSLNSLFFRHIRIQATTMGSPEEFRAMLEFVGRHRIEPVIDRVMPMDEAADALRLMQSFGQTGKIVLDIAAG
jgi:zinc-binding alcohol dehydrogenase/oxidoreductase